MNDTVILTHRASKVPGRVINLDQARVRHGNKADHMVRMLAVGDPLADAVIVEMDALGRDGRHILNAGLAEGLVLEGGPGRRRAFCRPAGHSAVDARGRSIASMGDVP